MSIDLSKSFHLLVDGDSFQGGIAKDIQKGAVEKNESVRRGFHQGLLITFDGTLEHAVHVLFFIFPGEGLPIIGLLLLDQFMGNFRDNGHALGFKFVQKGGLAHARSSCYDIKQIIVFGTFQ